MQRHLSRLLKINALISLSALSLACTGREQDMYPDQDRKMSPLMLSIKKDGDRILVLITNTSADNIIINKLLRANGVSPELTFFFDGHQAKFNESRTAVIEIQELDEASHEIAPEQVIGVSIRRSDLLGMFVITPNSCSKVVVRYKDMLNVQNAYADELESNSINFCFSKKEDA